MSLLDLGLYNPNNSPNPFCPIWAMSAFEPGSDVVGVKILEPNCKKNYSTPPTNKELRQHYCFLPMQPEK